MDFGSSGREGFNEEQMGKGKLFFTYSSSSCSSSQRETQLAPLSNTRWEQQPHQIYSSPNWLGNRHEPEDDNEPTAKETTSEADRKRVDSDSTLELKSNESGNIIEKEHMFDKVVTPSDVGKLNRLVIPKLHAEKYFPLDSLTNEKGLMLNFEDRNGKPWRFRYSYWSSSQSYVMTKGWSRFVKDKKLDAGDIVLFQRGVGELDKDRFFIDWRRRPHGIHPHHQHQFSTLHRSIQWSPLLMLRRRPPPETRRDHHLQYLSQINPLKGNSYYGGYPTAGSNVVNDPGGVFYLRSAMAAAPVAPPKMGMGMGMMEWQQQGGVVKAASIVFDSVPVVQAKRLRLFGVNMECPISQSDDCDMSSTTTVANHTMASLPPQLSSSSLHHLHLKLNNGIGTPLPPQ